MNIELIDILRYSRRHESKTEALFINEWLIPTINKLGYKPTMDAVGNIWVEAGEKELFPYLFVAHIDTCHQKEGMFEPKQVGNIISLDGKDVMFGCLGADDGVGIYANLRMMQDGVRGTFLFTRGEERGGIGASYIAKSTPHKLEGFTMSIEVDRAGTSEIIASQSYGECASEDFCNELGVAIGLGQTASHMGVYTDVSEFASIIPENVNIAAGYENQHTYKETVNLHYVENLIQRLITLDYSKLTPKRTAGDYGTLNASWWDRPGEYMSEYDRFVEYVQDNPEKVANFLDVCGIDTYEIETEWDRTVEWEEKDDDKLAVGMW